MLDGDPGGDMRFTLGTQPAPANDDFADAVAVTGLPFADERDTRGATRVADDPVVSCAASRDYDHSVWYRYTARDTGRLDVSATRSSYDTVLAVYTGERGNLR